MRTTKRSHSTAAAAICATAALLALTACGTTASDPAAEPASGVPKTIDTVLLDYPFTALPIYEVLTGVAQDRADELGVSLELTNDNMDLAQQVSNLTTWQSKAPDAVVSFPMDSAAIESLAQGFQDKGSLWVTYGGDMEGQDASLQFSFYDSGYLLGEDAGRWANEQLDGKGKAILLIDQLVQLGQERTQGIVDGLAETAPGVEVVTQQQGISPEEGLSVTTSALSQHPDANIVLAAAGDAAQGAYQALVGADRAVDDPNTYVGGLDGNLSLLQAMERGEFVRGLTTIDPVAIGNAVIDVPIAVAAGEIPDGGVFNVEVELYTRDHEGLAELIMSFGG